MIALFLAKSADPDEILHSAAFHLGLHCLAKYMLVLGVSSIQRLYLLFMPCLSPTIPDTKLLFLKKTCFHYVFLDQVCNTSTAGIYYFYSQNT